MHYQELQDQGQSQGRVQKLLSNFDLFEFKPFPTTQPVSTKYSKIATLVVVLLFMAYFIYSIASFFTNNTPRLNSYQVDIDPKKSFQSPELAIAFIYGINLDTLLNNTNDDDYFTISFVQYTKSPKNKTQRPIPLKECKADWLGNLTQQPVYKTLYCPTEKVDLRGLLYITENATYPRFEVTLCKNQGIYSGKPCRNATQILGMTGGGRIFLFLRKNSSKNFATGSQSSIEFNYFNFFLIPQTYLRVNLETKVVQTRIYPDLLTSFSRQEQLETTVPAFQTLPSNVMAYNEYSMLSINFILQPEIMQLEVVYPTIMDVLSLIGAFWGVLAAVFGLCSLYYNRYYFYENNPAWKEWRQKKASLRARASK